MAIILSMLVGALIGSLINFLADVLPAARCITRPVCSHCDQAFSAKDYLLSFKCSNCHQRVSPRHLIVLICSMALSVLLYYYPFQRLSFWAALPLMIFLGVIFVIDIEHHVVLFETTLFGLAICLLYGIFLHGVLNALLGGLAGLLIMLTLYFLGIGFSKLVGKIRNQKISEVAFGFGDVFASTFLGLLTGWPAIAGAIIIAMLAFGAFGFLLISVLLIFKRYRAFANAQPFVPFLILGVIVIFYL